MSNNQGKTKEEILRERRKQKILGGANDRLNIITGVQPTKIEKASPSNDDIDESHSHADQTPQPSQPTESTPADKHTSAPLAKPNAVESSPFERILGSDQGPVTAAQVEKALETIDAVTDLLSQGPTKLQRHVVTFMLMLVASFVGVSESLRLDYVGLDKMPLMLIFLTVELGLCSVLFLMRTTNSKSSLSILGWIFKFATRIPYDAAVFVFFFVLSMSLSQVYL